MIQTQGSGWFKWRHYHQDACDVCRVAFEAAFALGERSGRQKMLDESARWVQLEPLLADVLNELIELRLARESDALEAESA